MIFPVKKVQTISKFFVILNILPDQLFTFPYYSAYLLMRGSVIELKPFMPSYLVFIYILEAISLSISFFILFAFFSFIFFY